MIQPFETFVTLDTFMFAILAMRQFVFGQGALVGKDLIESRGEKLAKGGVARILLCYNRDVNRSDDCPDFEVITRRYWLNSSDDDDDDSNRPVTLSDRLIEVTMMMATVSCLEGVRRAR